jgi:tRNA-dihydrouridine synthase B
MVKDNYHLHSFQTDFMAATSPFLYLAPIRGLTDALLRSVLASHFKGFDAAVAPFINPQRKAVYDDRMLRDVLPASNRLLPIVPQLLNTTAEDFLELAARLEGLGYSHINWNLGCPAPMVARKKRGSGLLPHPELILGLLDAVMPRLPIALSIKTRLGFYDFSELELLLPQLDQYPLKEIIIHTRLGVQLYKGDTDPDKFSACMELSAHRLVYNGDICDLADYNNLSQQFPGIRHWMIGRGALGNPFLAEEIKAGAGSEGERLKRLNDFHEDLLGQYERSLSGPGHILARLKQLWSYLIFCFPGQEKNLKKILKTTSLTKYRQLADRLLSGRGD